MSRREKELILGALDEAVSQFSDSDAVKTFVTHVLTESEQLVIGRRLLIAQRLLAGQTQFEIMNDLGVSPNTLTNTRRWLEGKVPEYGTVIRQTQQAARDRAQKRRKGRPRPIAPIDPTSFAGLQQKYPLHFLLFTLLDQATKSEK